MRSIPFTTFPEIDAFIKKVGGQEALDFVRQATGAEPLTPATQKIIDEQARLREIQNQADMALGAAHGAFALGPARLNVGEGRRAEAIVPLEDERGLRLMTEVMVRALKRSGVSGGGGAVAYNVDLRGAFLPDERSVERLFRLLEEKRRRTRRIDLGRA